MSVTFDLILKGSWDGNGLQTGTFGRYGPDFMKVLSKWAPTLMTTFSNNITQPMSELRLIQGTITPIQLIQLITGASAVSTLGHNLVNGDTFSDVTYHLTYIIATSDPPQSNHPRANDTVYFEW